MKRLRELDFLRGIAIILVLCRHQFLFSFTQKMGWIGVDLFFVLSGYLVSGLLFREYLKFGNIKPGRFLIRRGFKIYPIYYIFFLLYLSRVIAHHHFNIVGCLSDILFVQNYVWGLGFAIPPSWSLAIEEHFYFGLSFFLWLAIKKNSFNVKTTQQSTGLGKFEKTILIMMLSCLGFRFLSNLVFPGETVRNATMTHLRIDSLLAGVFIAYLYYFKKEWLKSIFEKYKLILIVVSFLGLSWTPFISIESSFFMNTIGFSFLYISFGIVLTCFILIKDMNQRLNKVFSRPVVDIVSRIGYCSYSIYIVHVLVNSVVENIRASYNLYNNQYLHFIITFIFSVISGMIMTYYIESYFLKMRDKYYPSRVA